MTERITVLLADDHAMFRAGLKALLEDSGAVSVVGGASSGNEAVELVGKLRPDVVVMDLSMPGSNGLEATRRLAALDYSTQILIVTSQSEREFVVPVISAGASGFLSKSSADEDLLVAVRTVAGGEVYLPPSATTLLLKHYRDAEGAEGPALSELSAREQEVLALSASGFSAKEIGAKLFISPKTVDTYRARIMRKLGLGHRSEVVRFALRAGLLKDV